jgi:hypothetical protein
VAVDTVNNELAVSNIFAIGNSVTVYARTANGNVAPLRTLSGGATGLNNLHGPAVDTVNNELAVANTDSNSVTVYARTANGNVAPLRTLVGAATGLNSPTSLAITVGAAPPTPTPTSTPTLGPTSTPTSTPTPAPTLTPTSTPTPVAPGAAGVDVPALDSWGLIALSLILAALGVFAIRRMSP